MESSELKSWEKQIEIPEISLTAVVKKKTTQNNEILKIIIYYIRRKLMIYKM